MSSKLHILAATFVLLSAGTAKASTNVTAVKDSTINRSIREYVEEVGFYQKANRDLGDPRFMFSDSKGNVDFGINAILGSKYPTMSAIANFFWNIDEFSYLGVEYLFGTRRIYVNEGEPDFGRAHRLALVMAYCF